MGYYIYIWEEKERDPLLTDAIDLFCSGEVSIPCFIYSLKCSVAEYSPYFRPQSRHILSLSLSLINGDSEQPSPDR